MNNQSTDNLDKILKISLVLLGVIIIVLVAQAWYFLKLKNKSLADLIFPPQEVPMVSLPEDKLEVEPERELSNLEIAEKVLNWLDEQRDEDGVYLHSLHCTSFNECELTKGNPPGIAAIWGRYKYYQSSGNQKDLEIVKKDLDIYTNHEKVETIQNDFWNCSLMYELWESENFSESENEKIKRICNNSAYADLQLLVQRGISVPFFRYSMFSSDLSTRYLWWNDEKDFERASLYLELANNIYSEGINGGEEFSNLEKCALGKAHLDFYQVVENNENLIRAIELWEKSENKGYVGLLEKAVCAIFNNKLFGETGDNKYFNYTEALVEDMIIENFNYYGYQANFDGDGSFITLEPAGNVTKSIRENGLIIGILANEK